MSAEAKAALRIEAGRRREAACADDKEAGARLVAHLPAGLIPPQGAAVAGYLPFRTEIDPLPLMHALAARGLSLALPCTPARGSDAPLAFRLWREGEPLASSAFGVAQPSPKAALVTPALALVPLLAFDAQGGRLGYGAGHYDRTLPTLAAADPAFRAIGLAYAQQQVERLPAEPHDHPLDGVLTPQGYIAARKL